MYTRLTTITLLVLISAFSVSCRGSRGPSSDSQQRILPQGVQGVYLGMERSEFLETHPFAEFQDMGANFREVYLEEFENKDYESIVYYIDADAPFPVYELIINYPEKVNVANLARRLYGVPNYNETEWWFEDVEDFPVHIWLYKQKIVIAGIISNTEWAEEMQ